MVFRVDVEDVDVARDRLRGLLKVALRRFGMRWLGFREERVARVEEMRANAGAGRWGGREGLFLWGG